MTNAALAIILDPSKTKVLLVQRRDVPVWVLPGGGIDPGESPEAAAVREVLEETGLHVKVRRKVAEYTPINRLSLFTHTFECEILDGTLNAGLDCRQAQFFLLNELPETLFFLHKDWIEDALLNQSTVIKKPLIKITYLELLKYFCRRPWQVLRFLYTRLFS